MPDPVLCQQCGNAIPDGSPWGLCPNCLLRTALEQGTSPALVPLLPNLRYFGDYELLGEIARGGMGVVYRARQVSLDRIVAVKMMRPGFLATDAEIQRFRAEARTAASLQHPNIVAIHEVGEFDGLHYFSMDFVEGPSLAALVRERPLAPAEAARHVRILAETVEYAHTRGILHRDLKPSNVLLDAAGRPRVTDFGLARHLDADSSATSAGSIVGTPAYMSPEQASGDDARLSPASDVYSLGAILYELLTGQPPFRAANQIEVVRQVKEDKPAAPRTFHSQIDPALETICLRCLEKDPLRRYRSASDLAAALAATLAPPEAAQPTPGPLGWLPRYRLPIVLTALVAALLLLILQTTRRKSAPTVTHTATSPGILFMAPGLQTAINSAAATKVVPLSIVSSKKASRPGIPMEPPMPVALSIEPRSGSGPSQLFHFRYAAKSADDPAGMAEISFHDAARACVVFVEPGGRVSLQYSPEGGPRLRLTAEAGSLSQLENSVCSIDLSSVSIRQDGETLDIALPVTFKPSFAGPKEVESWPWDKPMRRRAKTPAMGRWTVTQPGNTPAPEVSK